MSSLPTGTSFVDLGPERLRDVLELDTWAFPSAHGVEEMLEVPCPIVWERSRGVVADADPGSLVALRASYPFATTPVPGATLPAAGLTWVGVHPGWRRKGLLRAMISEHFQHCLTRGEPLSVLTASEPGIYGRFGYGLAARQAKVSLPRGAALQEVPGSGAVSVRLETARPERHQQLLARLHASVGRPGWVSREAPEQVAAQWSDAPLLRGGKEPARVAIARSEGVDIGYAVFRRKEGRGAGGATGVVEVEDLVAQGPAARHALWSTLLDLDLTTRVSAGPLALDDPLFSLLIDVRAALGTWQDNLWVRLIDVPTALAGRRYQSDVDVVLQVSDPLLAANNLRIRLQAAAFEPATVTSTSEPAELSLDVGALSSAYFGGTSLVELAGAGQITQIRPGALRRASVGFGWVEAPLTNWIF